MRSTHTMHSAIAAMQRVYGLNVTGTLDEKTKEWVCKQAAGDRTLHHCLPPLSENAVKSAFNVWMNVMEDRCRHLNPNPHQHSWDNSQFNGVAHVNAAISRWEESLSDKAIWNDKEMKATPQTLSPVAV